VAAIFYTDAHSRRDFSTCLGCPVASSRETQPRAPARDASSLTGTEAGPTVFLVGQASCLSLNDGQDARPTKEEIASLLRTRKDSAAQTQFRIHTSMVPGRTSRD